MKPQSERNRINNVTCPEYYALSQDTQQGFQVFRHIKNSLGIQIFLLTLWRPLYILFELTHHCVEGRQRGQQYLRPRGYNTGAYHISLKTNHSSVITVHVTGSMVILLRQIRKKQLNFVICSQMERFLIVSL